MTREQKIMNRLQEHYDYLVAAGYEVVCLMLQGSQNYGLDEYTDEYMSDIDSKAIVLPHFRDFVEGSTGISATLVMENNEHIDVKDIRVMFDMFIKQNVSYIELLFTPFKIVNPKYAEMINYIFDNREKIAAINHDLFLKCILGMSGNKLKALCHPYPNLKEKIEKYGFDGKQLSHCVRLFEFISRYIAGTPLEECYISEDREMLMNLKKQLNAAGNRVLTQEEAVSACNFYFNATKMLVEGHLNGDEVDYQTIEEMKKLKTAILMKFFKEEVAACSN